MSSARDGAGHGPRPRVTRTPATASTTTSGAASLAVASNVVASCAATTIVASPIGGSSAPGSGTPAMRWTSSPQPYASAAISSGKMSQATSSDTGAVSGPPRTAASYY